MHHALRYPLLAIDIGATLLIPIPYRTAAQGDDRYDKGRPRASVPDWLRRPLPGTGEAGAPSQRALAVGGLEHGNGVPAGQFRFSVSVSVMPIFGRTYLQFGTSVCSGQQKLLFHLSSHQIRRPCCLCSQMQLRRGR